MIVNKKKLLGEKPGAREASFIIRGGSVFAVLCQRRRRKLFFFFFIFCPVSKKKRKTQLLYFLLFLSYFLDDGEFRKDRDDRVMDGARSGNQIHTSEDEKEERGRESVAKRILQPTTFIFYCV